MKKFLKHSHDLTRFVRFIRTLAWKKGRGRQIEAYISGNEVRKLQIGCGSNMLAGWFNTDYIPGPGRIHLDASETFPFPENCFNCVFSEHAIEHIHYRDALAMLKECHRVLKPGGRIRIATPNLRVYADFLKPDLSQIQIDCIEYFFNDWIKTGFHAAKNYEPVTDRPSPVFVLNDLFLNYEHRFVYDFEALGDLIGAAGFGFVEEASCGLSSYPDLSGLETHNDRINSFSTLVVEAQK